MFFLALLSVLIPQILGLALILALWPNQRPLRSELSIKLCLATGVGFGVSSLIYFVQLSLYGPSRGVFIGTQATLVAGLVATLLYRARAAGAAPADEPRAEASSGRRTMWALSIVFLVGLASAVTTLIFSSLRRPHGEWDAWAVYNMKARFIFKAGEQWKEVFSEPMYWSGTDYPLLIPAAIASCWTVVGTDTLAVPSMIAVFFTLATVGLVVSALARMRSVSQGLLAGLILLCTPYFVMHGGNQYADIPIGFFFTATIVLLSLYDRQTKPGYGLLILAGITAGLAGWTKNEGNLFIIVVLVSRLVVIARQRTEWKPYFRQALFFIAGALPMVVAVLYIKLALAQPNGLISPRDGPSMASKLMDFSRYQLITDYFIKYILGFGKWAVNIVPLLFFYLLLLGTEVEGKEKRGIAASLLTLGIMLAGYFMIYVISPRDLSWHIITSLDRLLSQLWPGFIFLIFSLARTPEQAFAKKEMLPA